MLAEAWTKTVSARREAWTIWGEFVDGDMCPRIAPIAPVARMGARNDGPPKIKRVS